MIGHVTAEEVIARMRPDPLLAVEEFAVAVLPRTAGFDVECPGSPYFDEATGRHTSRYCVS